MSKRSLYFVLFITALVLLCFLLRHPYLDKLFYPYRYRESIETFAALNHLDPLFIAAVIHVESGFDSDALSVKGARGLMQVMPVTAEWVARQIGTEYCPEMLFEPHYNLKIGCWYLADLFKVFDGETAVVLAAYNGGRGEVRRWLDRGIWSGCEEELDRIPFSETRNFVQRVLERYRTYRGIYGTEDSTPKTNQLF